MDDISYNGNQKTLITQLFQNGYQYKEILEILRTKYGIEMSIRTLHRSMRSYGLKRNGVQHSSVELITNIESEIQESGENRGYRSIYQHLIEKGIQISQHTVRKVMKEIDPEGVNRRSRHCIKRRKYTSDGPNDVWHLDGNDKLKPFGFCIHGCIDGFSRKMLWLVVSDTNKDPFYIARYFTDAVKTFGKLPKLVRSDKGTENVHVCTIQKYLRRQNNDSFSGEKSFRAGKSVSNQRIEQWWSYLKRNTLQSWINYFKDLRDQGLFDDGDCVHNEAIKFCFHGLIQADLDRIKSTWNHHSMRKTNNAESPGGKPNILYYLPSNFNARDCGFLPDIEELEILISMYSEVPKSIPCQDELVELAFIIMEEKNLQFPKTRSEGQNLFLELVSAMELL